MDPVVAVRVTEPEVALLQVARPFVASAALLMLTSSGSEFVHVAYARSVQAFVLHPAGGIAVTLAINCC